MSKKWILHQIPYYFRQIQQGITLTTLYMLLHDQQFNNKRSSFNHVDEK